MSDKNSSPKVPYEFTRDLGDLTIVADALGTKWAQSSAARRAARAEATEAAKKKSNEAKYTPRTQPRDADGKYKKILARLKLNLGDQATEELASQIEAAEAAQIAGNYGKMREAGADVIKMIEAAETGALPKGAVKNLRRGAAQLGRVMAYLPMPQGESAAKVRFTDIPPATKDLVRDMVERVENRLDPADAAKYVAELNAFMSGARTMSADDMSSHLNALLRVLA